MASKKTQVFDATPSLAENVLRWVQENHRTRGVAMQTKAVPSTFKAVAHLFMTGGLQHTVHMHYRLPVQQNHAS
jgi:hypothetical protein